MKIARYKGALEEWYVAHDTIGVYFMALFATAWAVLFPKSSLVWRVFPGLPPPPLALQAVLNYPDG